MKKSGIAAAALGMLCLVGSSAVFAQAKQVYWMTSGMFGPFPITGLIPTVPKEKQRDITIPVNMWLIDHPKGLVVFDTGNNVAISTAIASRTGTRGSATCSSPARSAKMSSTHS